MLAVINVYKTTAKLWGTPPSQSQSQVCQVCKSAAEFKPYSVCILYCTVSSAGSFLKTEVTPLSSHGGADYVARIISDHNGIESKHIRSEKLPYDASSTAVMIGRTSLEFEHGSIAQIIP